MDHSLLFPAVVAPSDFDPTAARPGQTGSTSGTVVRPAGQTNALRPSAKPWAVDRPLRRSLLDLGLAVGPDAGAWEAGMLRADAAARHQDRVQGAAAAKHAAQAAPEPAAPEPAATDAAPADPADPAPAADPQAMLAMAREVQSLYTKRQKLAEELAALEQQHDALQAELFDRLRQAGLAPPRATPEPERPPPGSSLPNGTWS